MKSFLRIGSVCLVLQLALSSCAQEFSSDAQIRSPLKRGLVVEAVLRNAEGQKAGVRPGDILLTWQRGSTQGDLKSPFDLVSVFLEQAPRGPVIINGLQNHRKRKWTFHSDSWGISVRPNFSETLLSIYLEGQASLGAGRLSQAIDHFRMAAAETHNSEPKWLSPWFLSHLAKALPATDQWNVSDGLYEEAIREAGGAEPEVVIELLRQRAAGPAGRQDLAAAKKYHQLLLSHVEKLKNKELTRAHILRALGLIELQSGDYSQAEEHFTVALAVGEATAPNSVQTILALANLAVIYQDEGDFQKSEKFYLRALEKEEKYFPNSSHLERTLSDLGVLFDQEGDFVRAEAYHRRALRIAAQLAPESPDVADILANLAECILERGNPLQAESYQKRALSIRQRFASASLSVANSIAGLGKIARMRGDLASAERYYREALDIAGKIGAADRDVAGFLIGLAAVLRQKRDLPGAEALYREALELIEKDDPTSIDRATTLAELAGTMYREKHANDALESYRQAFELFENRALHLGNIQEIRSRYRAEHARYYEEYTMLLIEQGQPALALEALEGARARSLLEMLAQARVDTNRGGDPALREREHNLHRLLTAKTEYRLRLISRSHTDAELATANHSVEELLLEYQQVQAQLRTSPDYAELNKLQILSVGEIQSLLDPDTLLLEYSLTDRGSHVWAVSGKSLSVYALPKRLAIETAARRVYRLLTSRNHDTVKPGEGNGESAEAKYAKAAQRLSEMVLGPVTPLLKEQRLLIVSNGALQYIPFSALPAPGKRGNREPLIVKHEIINLPSASVLAQLRQQALGRKKAPRTVAVLADPVFDPSDERLRQDNLQRNLSSPFGQLRSDLNRSAADLGLTRDGPYHLNRLLYTRNEAKAVMAVTAPGTGMLALDFAASRQLATSPELAKYHTIHFATHGILDNKHPELSGLVLSLVGPDGKPQPGFLKLQDIYNMKLPVDLVVLSGCETGLGEQINGEGLIGLTRGFMNAGATRVIASLWKISDTATAILMADLYRFMENNGMRPAAALRAAQVRMWKRKQWTSPYYWAAFQIEGEWR